MSISKGNGEGRMKETISPEEFKEKILSYGLVSSTEVFKDEKLLGFFIPIMRADFEAVEEYHFEEREKLDIDITVFWGMNDPSVRYEDIVRWKELTNGMFTLHSFPGGHFFIFENMENFVSKLDDELSIYYNIS